jgi:hypothetical protein
MSLFVVFVQVGVVSIPEIIEYDLTDNDLFAIWASDGVWYV